MQIEYFCCKIPFSYERRMKKVVATSELKEISKTVFYISLIVFTLYDLFLVILLESNLTQNT